MSLLYCVCERVCQVLLPEWQKHHNQFRKIGRVATSASAGAAAATR